MSQTVTNRLWQTMDLHSYKQKALKLKKYDKDNTLKFDLSILARAAMFGRFYVLYNRQPYDLKWKCYNTLSYYEAIRMDKVQRKANNITSILVYKYYDDKQMDIHIPTVLKKITIQYAQSSVGYYSFKGSIWPKPRPYPATPDTSDSDEEAKQYQLESWTLKLEIV